MRYKATCSERSRKMKKERWICLFGNYPDLASLSTDVDVGRRACSLPAIFLYFLTNMQRKYLNSCSPARSGILNFGSQLKFLNVTQHRCGVDIGYMQLTSKI